MTRQDKRIPMLFAHTVKMSMEEAIKQADDPVKVLPLLMDELDKITGSVK